MKSQQDLFEPYTRARSTDPGTSHEAAEAISSNLRKLQAFVLETLREHPNGLTDYELEEKCGSHGSTYRTRRAELAEMGLVEQCGHRIIAGSNRNVWRATD